MFFFPYWGHTLLRHSLDEMHIEINVCGKLIGTLLNIKGATKDDEKSRSDLMERGIRYELHLID